MRIESLATAPTPTPSVPNTTDRQFPINPLTTPSAMPIAARTGTPCLPQVEEAITSNGLLCAGQAGSKFWQVATPLTDFQLTTVCLTGTCLNLAKELQKIAGTDECVTTDGFFLYQDVLNPVLKQCGEAKVEPPTLLPSSSSGGKSAPSSASSRHTRVATLAVAALGVAQLVLML